MIPPLLPGLILAPIPVDIPDRTHETGMRALTIAAVGLALALSGCGAAVDRIPPSRLGITARDAYLEARTAARVWAEDARLRWLEGVGIDAAGLALPGQGEWRFHYTAPGRSGEVLVRVGPLETAQEERPASSPPGYVIGDNALDGVWVDSPDVAAAVAAAAGEAFPATLLLVPTRPAQWIVRAGDGDGRWRVDAGTGEVIDG